MSVLRRAWGDNRRRGDSFEVVPKPAQTFKISDKVCPAGTRDAFKGVPFALWGMQSMRSLIVKRSIAIGGRETSVSLEDAFWSRLKEIARSPARAEAFSELLRGKVGRHGEAA
jgi:Ribbon-helix-helix domain